MFVDKPVDTSVDKSVDKSEETKKPAEKPISLRPLEFEEAVRDLLKTPPKPHKPSQAPKKVPTGRQ